ncbi:MAG: ABC transporter substrate-binding protein [Deltaproteobacteria bacterium]|nr:ABC transporter substrate-binding protein [Deltaproteobacteria bacterium]
MKKFLSAALCLSLLVGLGWAMSGPAMAGTLKVGIVDCYSGPPSTYTNDVRDAFTLYMDQVNKNGGILGNKVEVLTRDSKFKVDIGLSAAKELIMRENVNILMGTINSALALAISDLAKNEKIPFLATFSKSEKITGAHGHRYVFSMNENTALAGKAAAVGLAKKPFKKYWIAGDDYEYGHAIADAVWKNLKLLKPDVELLGQSWWKVGEPDFTPYITAILAAKPDAVIVATGGRDCVPFLKAAKATGFNQKVPFYMHTATELSTLKPLGLDAPEGVLGTSNYFFYYPKSPANEKFVADFKKAYGREPKVGALYGYITAEFMDKAYTKAGSLDNEKFIDAMEGLTVDSPVGPITMRAFDHQVMLPMYMGVTKKEPGYDFLVADDIVTIPAEEAMPSIEEIKKARGQ